MGTRVYKGYILTYAKKKKKRFKAKRLFQKVWHKKEFTSGI